MRAFIVLCLLAVACADKLGYNYNPVGHSDSGLSFVPGSSVGSTFPSYSDSGTSGSYSTGGGIGGGIGGAVSGGLEKEFYHFSANEDDFNEPAGANQLSNSLKQNLRVIFIKAPENRGLENAVLGLAKQAAEQQTAIYVLHRQPDINELANKFNAVRSDNNRRPEVHFVKYRTPEDAAHAQHTIQSQYDALGGSSQTHNGGVAPTINFATHGSTGHVGFGGSSGLGGATGFGGAGGFGGASGLGGFGGSGVVSGFNSNVGSNYLPPSLRRRFRR